MFNPATGDRFNVPNTAIVITDGQSNINHAQTIPEAEELQRAADVYVIGVTDQIDINELLVWNDVPTFVRKYYWRRNYRVARNLAKYFRTPYIYQILTDLRNYFSVRIGRKFVMILSHTSSVSLYYLVNVKCFKSKLKTRRLL